jgi:hypothetical protein
MQKQAFPTRIGNYDELMKKKMMLLSLIAVLALSLSACSSDSEESSSESTNKSSSGNASAIQASLASVAKEDTYRIDGTIAINGTVNGEPQTYELTVEGVSSYDGKTASLTSDFSDLIAGVTGTDFEFVVEQRIIDGVVYTKTPNFLGGSTSWIAQDYPDFATDSSAGNQNPTQFLKTLEAISGDVTEVGTEEINGSEATHYRAVISKEDLQNQFDSQEMKDYYAELGITGEKYEEVKRGTVTNDVPVDVWIDNETQLVSRVQMELATANSIVGDNLDGSEFSDVSVTVTMNFSDWGAPLEVEAPPQDEIKSQEEIESSLREQLSNI